jgi:hypothetical protein
MKKILVVLIFCTFFTFSCNNDNSKKDNTDKESYEKAKQEMLKKEQKNPRDFLVVDGHENRNFLGQTVIKGKITNKASVAVFKDINLKLSFYSKTMALLESDDETVFEVLHPGETKNFKTKYFAPKGTDSVALSVIAAKVVYE